MDATPLATSYIALRDRPIRRRRIVLNALATAAAIILVGSLLLAAPYVTGGGLA